MSLRRRKRKRKRIYATSHGRAASDPSVRKRIFALKRCWNNLVPLERGDQLLILIGLGCSSRGLRKMLDRSATTIRRHWTLAALPEKARAVVIAGGSRKTVLANKVRYDRLMARKKRIDEDAKTGVLSDEVTGIILKFCLDREIPPNEVIGFENASLLLNSVFNRLCQFDTNRSQAIRVPKRLSMAELFERTRPAEPDRTRDLGPGEAHWLEHRAEWLANIVWAKAPERPIWQNALGKASNRAPELWSNLTAEQIEEDWLDRVARFLAGPSAWKPN